MNGFQDYEFETRGFPTAKLSNSKNDCKKIEQKD